MGVCTLTSGVHGQTRAGEKEERHYPTRTLPPAGDTPTVPCVLLPPEPAGKYCWQNLAVEDQGQDEKKWSGKVLERKGKDGEFESYLLVGKGDDIKGRRMRKESNNGDTPEVSNFG